MSSLRRLQKSIFQMRRIILDNERIRRLLYHMTPNALSNNLSSPDITDVEKSVTLTPVIEHEDGVALSFKNGFISIYPKSSITDEGGVFYTISVAVFVQDKYYILDNDKVRALEIMEEVLQVLNGKKLASAGSLNYLGFEQWVIETGVFAGFIMNWELVDGETADF